MDSVAGWSGDDRRDLFNETGQRRQLQPLLVEKDFWVCWTLARLRALEGVGGNIIFKGGTSLSKVFKVIHRFSEDIDVSIDRVYLGCTGNADPEESPTLSNTARNKRVGELRKRCASFVQKQIHRQLAEALRSALGQQAWELRIDASDPAGTTLLFQYPESVQGTTVAAPYVMPSVKIELGASSDPFPVEQRSLVPFAAEAFPDLFAHPACTLPVLSPLRTFWEKATILHAEYYRPSEGSTPPRLSRHYYDLACLWRSDFGAQALAAGAIRRRVVEHKSVYFRSSWARYDIAHPPTFRLAPPTDRLSDLRRDYQDMQPMLFRVPTPPTFDEVLGTIADLERLVNHTGP